jgi:hypothetical protein
MPQTINADASPTLDFSMVVPSLGEAGKSAENAAAHKQHLDNAKALENEVATKASSASVTTLNNRLETGGDIDGRIDTLEAAKIADEARLVVLEAQGVNDPLRRFQWSVSGEYPTPTLSAALAPTFGFGIGSTTVILPAGKVLRVKNVRYGTASMTTPGGGGIGKFNVRNRSSGVLYFNTAGRDGQESPNYKIADNSAGGTPLEVYLTAGFYNDAAATGTISIVESAGFWLDLSIE